MRIRTTFSAAILLGILASSRARISHFGNNVTAGRRSVPGAGSTFLLASAAQREGVLFAFAAFFVVENPVYFQLWRPVSGEARRFELIRQHLHLAHSNMSEEVYMMSGDADSCVGVLRGDRLGVYFPKSPGPIAYQFEATETLMFTTGSDAAYPHVSSQVTFDSLLFPYRFSAAAFTADLSAPNGTSWTRCPSVLIDGSAYTTPKPPIGPPAVTSKPPAKPPGESAKPSLFLSPSVATAASTDNLMLRESGTAVSGDVAGGRGPPGLRGPPGPPGQDAAPSKLDAMIGECRWCWRLFSPWVQATLLAWLFLLSVTFVVFGTYVCARCRRYGGIEIESSRFDSLRRAPVWQNVFSSNKYHVDRDVLDPESAPPDVPHRTAF